MSDGPLPAVADEAVMLDGGAWVDLTGHRQPLVRTVDEARQMYEEDWPDADFAQEIQHGTIVAAMYLCNLDPRGDD